MSAELFAKFATAKTLTQYGARIGEGRHRLILRGYGLRETGERGTIVAADFVVVDSIAHPIGSLVGCAWFVSDRSWQGERELSRAQAFVKALLGIEDAEQTAGAANALAGKAQPGIGIAIYANGVKRKNKTSGAEFIDVTWNHIVQTSEAIRDQRAAIEAGNAVAHTPAVATPPPTATPTASLLALLGK